MNLPFATPQRLKVPRSHRRWFGLGPILLLAACSSTQPPPTPSPALRQAQMHTRAAEQLALQGNWAASLGRWQSAAEQYQLLNRLPELASALHNAGQAHKHLGELTFARQNFNRAAELNLLLDRRADWWRNQIALLQVDEPADRSARIEKLLPQFSESSDPDVAGHFLNELGLWQEQRDTQKADETFHQASEQFRLAKNPRGRGSALANRARIHEGGGAYEAAAALWREALAEFERAADPRGIAHALAGEGRCLVGAGSQMEHAKELLRRAAENYRVLGADADHTNLVEVLEGLE